MADCPRDSTPLQPPADAQGAMWTCATCFGGFVKAPPDRQVVARAQGLEREEWDPPICCPEDGTQMQLVDIVGVAVDVCPQCGGAWLDDHEIEQLRATGLPGPEVEGEPGALSELGRAMVRQAETKVVTTVLGVLFSSL